MTGRPWLAIVASWQLILLAVIVGQFRSADAGMASALIWLAGILLQIAITFRHFMPARESESGVPIGS